jgi:hypothetical protein
LRGTEREGAEWVVREGVGAGGNNKRKRKKNKIKY